MTENLHGVADLGRWSSSDGLRLLRGYVDSEGWVSTLWDGYLSVASPSAAALVFAVTLGNRPLIVLQSLVAAGVAVSPALYRYVARVQFFFQLSVESTEGPTLVWQKHAWPGDGVSREEFIGTLDLFFLSAASHGEQIVRAFGGDTPGPAWTGKSLKG